MICRLTITTDDGRTAEGAQFTRGFVLIVWDGDDPRPEMWISVVELMTERPGWNITWIDNPAAGRAGGG
ncbi:hypothetical protein ACRYCC_26185 [Actinomadura scrupuli]|uniref:hypothetical protein n=1 Tax=Actinomadura scrupuli TaxID=559629 RepID=UPI003D996DBC